MMEKDVVEGLVRALLLYGIVRKWPITRLLEEYDHLGIPRAVVDEILSQ